MCQWVVIFGVALMGMITPISSAAQLLPPSYSFPVTAKEHIHRSPSLLHTASTEIPDLPRIGSPWTYTELGLFCRLDVQFERAFKFPVMFRLGGVRQVDAWEGKGDWKLER